MNIQVTFFDFNPADIFSHIAESYGVSIQKEAFFWM
jgi:hypothetical protein